MDALNTSLEVETVEDTGLELMFSAELMTKALNQIDGLHRQRDDLHAALNRYALNGLPRIMGCLDAWAKSANLEKNGSDEKFLADKLCKEAHELFSEMLAVRDPQQAGCEQFIDWELADVLIVALRLCSVRGKDPIELIRNKMLLNVAKYGGTWEGGTNA